jgi:transposase
MLDMIRQQPQVFKGIAVIDWKASHPDRTMRELAKEGVRGFRIYPGSDSPSSWLDQAGFDKMFHCGADEYLAMCPLIDPDALRERLRRRGIAMIAPHRSTRHRTPPQDGRRLRQYKKRRIVERSIAWLGNFHRLVVRYDRSLTIYQAFLHIACLMIVLRRVLK